MRVHRTAWSVAQAHVPVVLKGEFGLGKTTCVKVFSDWLNRECIHIPFVGATPEDIIGYPKTRPVPEFKGITEVTYNAIHEWMYNLIKNPNVVLLLDEIGRLDNEKMQNVVAQILDRSVGQFQLPEDIIIFGTTNDFDIGGLNDINYNIITRIAIYNVDISLQEEYKALVTGEYQTQKEFKLLPDDWEKYLPIVRMKLGSFYAVRRSAFQKQDTGITQETWVNPRTIHRFAIRGLAASLACGYNTPDDWFEVLRATVGTQFATDFMSWFREQNLPTPEEAFDIVSSGKPFPKKYINTDNPNPQGCGIILAIFGELLNYARTTKDEDNNLDKSINIWQSSINYLCEHYADIYPEPVVFTGYTYLKNNVGGVIPTKILSLMKEPTYGFGKGTND